MLRYLFVFTALLCFSKELFSMEENPPLEKEKQEIAPLKNVSDEEGKFALVPLPFYGTSLGFGLSLKLLYPNMVKGIYIDSISVATTEKLFVTFNSIGQKSIPLAPKIFWDLQVGGTHLSIKYFGTGNDVSLEDMSSYKHRSYVMKPKVGVRPVPPVELYLVYSHRTKRLLDFEDPRGVNLSAWESLTHTSVTENRIGYGFSYTVAGSEVRPHRGWKVAYNYLIASPGILRNDYSFREAIFSCSCSFPVHDKISVASNILYQKVSDSAPFYEDPNIRVRGIEMYRHKDRVTVALQNEGRIFIKKDWILVPFLDLGRVMKSFQWSLLTGDLHAGYGLGVRYIVKNLLVVRFDVGFSRGGEVAYIFNYGHTF